MSTKRARIIIGASAAGLLVLAGCSDSEGQDHSSMTGMVTTTSIAAPSSVADMGEHNAADMTFAQEMISHHSQAITMSNILLDKNDINPEVVRLAQQIKAAQQPEIDQMTGWLNDWGQPLEMGHSMGGMEDGMLSPEKLDELQQADTATAQRLYVEGMIAHHQGAVKMAENARRTSKNAAVQKLCDDVIRTQNAEIQTMQGMLPTL